MCVPLNECIWFTTTGENGLIFLPCFAHTVQYATYVFVRELAQFTVCGLCLLNVCRFICLFVGHYICTVCQCIAE